MDKAKIMEYLNSAAIQLVDCKRKLVRNDVAEEDILQYIDDIRDDLNKAEAEAVD